MTEKQNARVARVGVETLRRFAVEVLSSLGFGAPDAQDVADAMAWADARGVRGHGVVHRLAQCVARVQDGGTDPRAVSEVVSESTAAVVLEGNNAWGQLGATWATRGALSRANSHGIGVATVRNISSPAALGRYADLAAREGFVGIALTNCPALIAAPGGTSKVLGNQAHAFGFPAGEHPPVVFDSSLTLMSTTEMDRRIADGETLPDGVLLDRDGQPTHDPRDWVEGTLVPIGGHRGFGLALAFELLTSALAGSDRYGSLVGYPFEVGHPQGVTVTAIAIDASLADGPDGFARRVDAVIDAVHASGPAEARPRIPGERQANVCTERSRAGVPLTAAERDGLRQIAVQTGTLSSLELAD